jgi:catechol 2,3-dioxygenase-like lactoylglutathione lyase family enzyme
MESLVTPPPQPDQNNDLMLGMYLAHYTLYVSDLALSVNFYTQALALHNGYRPPFDGPPGAWLYTKSGAHVVHLNSGGPKPTVETSVDRLDLRVSYLDRALDHIAFTVSDFDAAVGRLIRSGIPHRLDQLPELGYRQAFLRDPDGVGIEINDFRDTPRARPVL